MGFFFGHQNTLFIQQPEKQTLRKAEGICGAKGSRLVWFDSKEELDYVSGKKIYLSISLFYYKIGRAHV